jgi:hypothetical protein
MPNDFLSLWSSSRRPARSSRASKFIQTLRGICLLALTSVAVLGCGEEDDGVTFDDDIRPLFNRRCTTCHRPVSPINVDIQNPFNDENGLVNGRSAAGNISPNSWAQAYPGETPVSNVVPFDPDNSFLMDKLTGELPRNGHGGAEMPLQVAPIDATELAVLERWVTDGAEPGEFFETQIRPIFGAEDTSGLFFGGKCVFCHYAGTPNEPDLTDPFGPKGLVNVRTIYRGDMVRVLPGNPEESLLILKVRAEQPDSAYGAPMPFSYSRLTESQLGLVRQWILEGALP